MPLDIQPKDFITILVPALLVDGIPQTRPISHGRWVLEVVSVTSAAEEEGHPDALKLRISMPSHRARSHFDYNFTIIPIPKLEGWGFLNHDEWPVKYSHEPMYESRLQYALIKAKKEKLNAPENADGEANTNPTRVP